MRLTVLGLFIYMVLSGVLMGAAKNWEAEECGKHTPIDAEDAIEALLWPMAIGAVLIIDDDRDINVCGS